MVDFCELYMSYMSFIRFSDIFFFIKNTFENYKSRLCPCILFILF